MVTSDETQKAAWAVTEHLGGEGEAGMRASLAKVDWPLKKYNLCRSCDTTMSLKG